MQKTPRIARAILASFVVAAAVAGTAYGVTRSATTVKSATIPPPPPLDAVAASVTALGGAPALPALAPYKAHKVKHFVKPAPRVVVLAGKNIVVLRKKHVGGSTTAATHPAAGGAENAAGTDGAEPNDSAETSDRTTSSKHKHHSDDGGQGDN